MTKLVVTKFGGSAIGPDGTSISEIVKRISDLKKDSKVIAVFSAPLTIDDEKKTFSNWCDFGARKKMQRVENHHL